MLDQKPVGSPLAFSLAHLGQDPAAVFALQGHAKGGTHCRPEFNQPPAFLTVACGFSSRLINEKERAAGAGLFGRAAVVQLTQSLKRCTQFTRVTPFRLVLLFVHPMR